MAVLLKALLHQFKSKKTTLFMLLLREVKFHKSDTVHIYLQTKENERIIRK